MPWETNFDEAQVLEKAMQAFWARGYEATSIEDLALATKLSESGIHAVFGGKRQLFIQALEHYEEEYRRAWLNSLRAHHGPRATILAVFEGVIGAALSDRSRAGCLLINTAIELSNHDPEIAEAGRGGSAGDRGIFPRLDHRGSAKRRNPLLDRPGPGRPRPLGPPRGTSGPDPRPAGAGPARCHRRPGRRDPALTRQPPGAKSGRPCRPFLS